MKHRPEQSKEVSFQVMAALIHLWCACFNVAAVVYHARRVAAKKEPSDARWNNDTAG